jgi:hypothetical protein
MRITFESRFASAAHKNTRILSLTAALLLPALSAAPSARAALVANRDALAPAAAAQQPSGFGPLDPSPPSGGLTPEQLIQKFGEREAAFAKARDQYTFRQSVKVQTISDTTGKPDGEYQEVTDIVFDDADRRTEHVVFAPQNTLTSIMMTQADFDDIKHRLPFILTTPELPQYDITYLGKQHVDEIETYVFDVKPKELVKGKRYFKGRIWVDQEQFEIVLINGKSVPDDVRPNHADLSPPYTTYYSEVDGGNWFPVYTKADGILHFPAQYGALAQDTHIRYIVKYEDYKRFHAKSRIIYNGEDLPPAAKPGDKPKPATPPAAATPASGDDAPIPPPTPPSENGVKQKPVPASPPN